MDGDNSWAHGLSFKVFDIDKSLNLHEKQYIQYIVNYIISYHIK